MVVKMQIDEEHKVFCSMVLISYSNVSAREYAESAKYLCESTLIDLINDTDKEILEHIQFSTMFLRNWFFKVV